VITGILPVSERSPELEGDSLIGYKIKYYDSRNRRHVTFEVMDVGRSSLARQYYDVINSKGDSSRVSWDEMERIVELAKKSDTGGLTRTSNCFPD
jgi:hypothetical protein